MTLYPSPEYKTSFESIGFSVQVKQFKIHFQDGHLGFLISLSSKEVQNIFSI